MRATGSCRPRSRRTPAIRRSSVASLAIVAFAVVAGGCAGTTKSGPAKEVDERPDRKRIDPAAEPAVVATTEPREDGTSNRAETLRAQADRDIQALLDLRRQRQAPADEATGVAAESPTAAPPRTATTSRPPRPAIEWNVPGGGLAAEPGATSARPAEAPAAAPPVARAADESVRVDPLPGGDPLETLSGENRLALDRIRMQLVQLRQELYRESIESDQPIRELIAIAAMGVVDPDLKLPQGAERDLTAKELELLEDLHRFFTGLGKDLDDESRAEDTIVSAVMELQRAMIKTPTLELPAATLCWRIGGFGDYDAFSPNAFLAHAEQQVILYLEIEGFESVLNKKSQWVTEIAQQLEIYSDRDGIPVWSEPWQKAVDVVNNKRRDFFTTQIITLPKALSVGRYYLKIRVRDEHSGAEAEDSITFEMVADPKLAAKVGR